jgi:hypothetical protein
VTIGVVAAVALLAAGSSIDWRPQTPAGTGHERRQTAGRASPSAAVTLAESRSDVSDVSLAPLEIGAKALQAELEAIWRETADFESRWPQGCSGAITLLAHDVWRLSDTLAVLELELEPPPLPDSGPSIESDPSSP